MEPYIIALVDEKGNVSNTQSGHGLLEVAEMKEMGQKMMEFENEYNAHRGKIVEVLVGNEAKARIWQKGFDNLDDFGQWLVENTMIDLPNFPLHRRKPAEKLLAIAKARVHKVGKSDTCSRCGGSGHYSYNPMYGTRCFKCSGSGHTLPSRPSKKWKEEVAALCADRYKKS